MSSSSLAGPVSIVIPVLNGAPYLEKLLTVLQGQRPQAPGEIILVDSGSTDQSVAIASRFTNTRIIPLTNFSHGLSRNLGARAAAGNIIVFLSQDALPQDEFWLRNLLLPFTDPQVAAAYSRQVPRDDAIFTERFFLAHRFPSGPGLRRENSSGGELALEDVFFSNVSSAARRSILLQYPFDEELIMSEDQQFSRDVIKAGYAVVYAADSVVVHSHNYSLKTVFQRYFDSVYSLTTIFPSHGLGTSTAMGKEYLRGEIRFVLKNHRSKIPYYLCYNLAKIGGTVMAHLAPFLPKFLLRRLSLHSYHWK